MNVKKDFFFVCFQSIPATFFYGTEIEVDQLVEIVAALVGSDDIEDSSVASIMATLMSCRGFFLNLAFLDDKQKLGEEI